MKKIIFAISAISILMLATCIYQPVTAQVNRKQIETNNGKLTVSDNSKFIETFTMFNSKITKDKEIKNLFLDLVKDNDLQKLYEGASKAIARGDNDLLEKIAKDFYQVLTQKQEYKKLIKDLKSNYYDDFEYIKESTLENANSPEEVRDIILSYSKVRSNGDVYIPGYDGWTDHNIWDAIEKILEIITYFILILYGITLWGSTIIDLIDFFVCWMAVILLAVGAFLGIENLGINACWIAAFLAYIALAAMIFNVSLAYLYILIDGILTWIKENKPPKMIDKIRFIKTIINLLSKKLIERLSILFLYPEKSTI